MKFLSILIAYLREAAGDVGAERVTVTLALLSAGDAVSAAYCWGSIGK